MFVKPACGKARHSCYSFCKVYMGVSVRICPGHRGWSGGAKVLGKLSVPGRLTSLDDSRARAYCACSRCGWGLF